MRCLVLKSASSPASTGRGGGRRDGGLGRGWEGEDKRKDK